MIPNPAEVIRKRWAAKAWIRLTALIPLIVGYFFAAIALVSILPDYQYLDLEEIIIGCTIVAVFEFFSIGAAVIIWFTAGPIARRMVSGTAEPACPRCRYKLQGLTEPKCPECGLDLPPDFLAGSQPISTPEPEAVRLVRLREAWTPWLRVIGAVITVPAALIALAILTTGIAAVISSMQWNDAEEIFMIILIFTIWFLAFAGIALTALITLFRARAIAHAACPKPGQFALEPASTAPGQPAPTRALHSP